MNTFSVNHRQLDAVPVVAVTGELTLETAPVLEQELARVGAGRPAVTVIDVAGVTFVSSIGMGALVAYAKAAQRWGGRVRLARASHIVADCFHRAHLDGAFELYPEVPAATAAPPPPPPPPPR
jgi:anti-anti-sigma factor